ncbi:MAG TPA: TIGR00282 family metallophosphoesterase [Bacteroidetes bacterium]|nr:TIGR00282 family metallophosphoesterase [Bacteroidota bacterium]
MAVSSDAVRILFIADIVGQPGMDAVKTLLPGIQKEHRIDFTIANGENANAGRGITEKQARVLFGLGVDLITGGNHTWENWQSKQLFANEERVLRPANYPDENPGKGYFTATLNDDTKISVLNIQGRTFMYPLFCPFRKADELIPKLKKESRIIFVDFHAEATAEKIALGWYLNGRVSAVVGTHTHVQTADERILPDGGTAYITDAGMTGAHDSVIGMSTKKALHRFLKQTPAKFEVAEKNMRINGVVVTIDKESGKAISIERVAKPEY